MKAACRDDHPGEVILVPQGQRHRGKPATAKPRRALPASWVESTAAILADSPQGEAWDALVDAIGAEAAEHVVDALDGAQVPTRRWLRRHLGLPRFKALIEAGFSIRRASAKIGIAEGTGRAWKKELLREDHRATTQPQVYR